MTATMSKRPRLTVDVPEDFKLAIRLACAKEDCSPAELIMKLISEHLAAELRDARRYQKPEKGD